eukprot:GHVS01026272.1.p1 GENE.GHVS01026272.1~~GHVS01026272.1.p1  ORF type:complete len:174 (+),score=29.87 GHVS01026272.1:169-690(+)
MWLGKPPRPREALCYKDHHGQPEATVHAPSFPTSILCGCSLLSLSPTGTWWPPASSAFSDGLHDDDTDTHGVSAVGVVRVVGFGVVDFLSGRVCVWCALGDGTRGMHVYGYVRCVYVLSNRCSRRDCACTLLSHLHSLWLLSPLPLSHGYMVASCLPPPHWKEIVYERTKKVG